MLNGCEKTFLTIQNSSDILAVSVLIRQRRTRCSRLISTIPKKQTMNGRHLCGVICVLQSDLRFIVG